MSGIEGDISTDGEIKRPRYVTTIIRDLNPTVENYLNNLLRFLPIKAIPVHKSSEYQPLVLEVKDYRIMGIFYDYLIRKEIHNLLKEEATDSKAAKFEKELVDGIQSELVSDDSSKSKNDHDKASVLNTEQLSTFVASYQKYKDPKNETLDIIEDVFNTSMMHLLYFGEPTIPFNLKLLNMDNIETVLKHVKSFNPNNIAFHRSLKCKYFVGMPDLILDDVLLDIRVSMHNFKVNNTRCKITLYQLILYALGVFIIDGKEIRKFKIYNPLKGKEYVFELPHLDFPEFLALVKQVHPL